MISVISCVVSQLDKFQSCERKPEILSFFFNVRKREVNSGMDIVRLDAYGYKEQIHINIGLSYDAMFLYAQ